MKSTILAIAFGFTFNLFAQEIEKKNYKNQPAIIESWRDSGVTLDFVQQNRNFIPGSDDERKGNYFLNDNKKLRTFSVSKTAKYFICNGNTATILGKFENVTRDKERGYFRFDIKNNEIVCVYQQCLP